MRSPLLSRWAPEATARADLLLEPLGGGQRRQRRRLLAEHLGGEPRDELVVELLGDDEALAGVAGLAGVLHASGDGGVDGGVEVVGAEHEERVGPAELEHDLLQVLAGGRGDGSPGALGPGQGDALHPRVADQLLDLLVGGVDVDVGALGEAGVGEDLREQRRRLGALRRVLEHDRVARRQVGAGEPGDLVGRVVPGHDPEDHAERAASYDRRALAVEEVDRLVGQELLGVVGVVAVDAGAEVDLPEGVVHRLAHLAVHRGGQRLTALGVEVGDLLHQGGPVGDRAGASPGVEGLRGPRPPRRAPARRCPSGRH